MLFLFLLTSTAEETEAHMCYYLCKSGRFNFRYPVPPESGFEFCAIQPDIALKNTWGSFITPC